MKDLKTTFAGLITAVIAFIASLGVVVPESWTILILAAGVAVIGFLAADKPPTP